MWGLELVLSVSEKLSLRERLGHAQQHFLSPLSLPVISVLGEKKKFQATLNATASWATLPRVIFPQFNLNQGCFPIFFQNL